MWNTLSQLGENARDEAQWLPSALSLWKLHLSEGCECSEPWLEMQTSSKLGSHDTIRKVLKHKCLTCPHIVHLNLICMNYDQKKGHKSNWEIDSRSQTPWKQRSNKVQLDHAIHRWKYIFKGYKIMSLHFHKILDLKKYEHPKFENNKSPSFGE